MKRFVFILLLLLFTVNLINANQASSVVAGGSETMSDLPIKLSKKFDLNLH